MYCACSRNMLYMPLSKLKSTLCSPEAQHDRQHVQHCSGSIALALSSVSGDAVATRQLLQQGPHASWVLTVCITLDGASPSPP